MLKVSQGLRGRKFSEDVKYICILVRAKVRMNQQ